MKRRRCLFRMFLATAAWVLASPAAGHDLGVARVELREMEPGSYELEARLPAVLEPRPPGLPARCGAVGEPAVRRQSTQQVVIFDIRCVGPPLGVEDSLLLPWRRDGAWVAADWADGTEIGRFFEGRGPSIEVPVALLRTPHRAAGETLRHYLVLGVEHILLGWDHLAFVLGLCLIARGWRLAKLVTAFTFGHSLTLAAAVLGLVRVPSAPVEACIALSIAFVAREVLARRGSRIDPSARHGLGLTVAFGLLHGLGFAGALAESGIQSSERFLGLISFNLGVELGQIVFVLAMLGFARLARQLPARGGVRLYAWQRSIAWALGILGMCWWMERVLGFVA